MEVGSVEVGRWGRNPGTLGHIPPAKPEYGKPVAVQSGWSVRMLHIYPREMVYTPAGF